jgi:hypothetical protein
MARFLPVCALLFLATLGFAQDFDIHAPASAIAGSEVSIATTGTGRATFYLVGPGIARKNDMSLGATIQLHSADLRNAGTYQALLCSSVCRKANFYVTAAKPASLSFLVHPSRVPVSLGDAVSGVAFPFDQFQNLVLSSLTVNFQLTAGNSALLSRAVRTEDGLAWFRTTSGKVAGTLQVVAKLDDVSARRVVQQVASDPCNLRIKGQRVPGGILVETEPVHDCSGNPVPDGTIVAFSATESNGKSTVDAPIKQGVARAKITASNAAVISVASGVVMGNELRVGGQP